MEVYKRTVDRVRGAMWAHHRKLLPERQAQRILGYVYSNKYEYQLRFDRMVVVGRELDGKVEVACTPAGHIKKVRVNPEFEDLTRADQERLVLSAYVNAVKQGRKLMQEAEMKIYGQFLRDIKPLVMGIRDNPEFYTVAPDSVELKDGVLSSASSKEVHRTIPYDNGNLLSVTSSSSSSASSGGKASSSSTTLTPAQEEEYRESVMQRYLSTDDGRRFLQRMRGKEYARYFMPQRRPAGAPGAKKKLQLAKKLELNVPYLVFDEKRLIRKNWQAYLDNRNVAEKTWTKIRLGDRMKQLRQLQASGEAWHQKVADGARY